MITLTDAIIRLTISFLLGAIVGFERQYHEKPAGFSTNTLICMGSTVFAMISLMSAQYFGGDPARIAAQIVTGVGFLGAGSIIREGNKISGLTTAAGIWVVAAIGMATGYGEFGIAGFAVILALVLQVCRRRILSAFESVKTFEYITIKCEPDIKLVTTIEDTIKSEGVNVIKSHFYKADGKLIIKLATDMSEKTFKMIFKKLLAFDEIISLDR